MATTQQATQGWKKEVRYSCEGQIGHVIGVGGVNVKKWLTHNGCTTIIDKIRKCIVIFGDSNIQVLQTTIEVQEKLLLYWIFIYSARDEHKIIKEDEALDDYEYEDGLGPWVQRGTDGKPVWT